MSPPSFSGSPNHPMDCPSVALWVGVPLLLRDAAGGERGSLLVAPNQEESGGTFAS